MSEMVKRVAAAIESKMIEECLFPFQLEDAARAAIEAMREPTQDMLDAATTDGEFDWPVMIDAALK